MSKTNIKLPNGFSLSLESEDAAGVPDVTQNAGVNELEEQEAVQKPVDDPESEYDAANNVDEGKEVEQVEEIAKANESTFYGLNVLKRLRKGEEGFSATKAFKFLKFKDFSAVKASPEFKAAVKEAKEWAAKKGYKFATKQEVQENKQTWGTTLFSGAAKTANWTNQSAKNKKVIDLIKTSAISVVDGIVVLDAVLTPMKHGTWMFFVRQDGKVFAKKLMFWKNSLQYAEESASVFSRYLSREADEAEAEDPKTSDEPVTAPETDKADEANDAETTDIDAAEEAVDDDEGEKKTSTPDDSEEKAVESFFKNWGIK